MWNFEGIVIENCYKIGRRRRRKRGLRLLNNWLERGWQIEIKMAIEMAISIIYGCRLAGGWGILNCRKKMFGLALVFCTV